MLDAKPQMYQQQPVSGETWANQLQTETDRPLQADTTQNVYPIMPSPVAEEKPHKRTIKEKIKGKVKAIKNKFHHHDASTTDQPSRERTGSESSLSSSDMEGYTPEHPLPADQITEERRTAVAEDAAKAARKQGLGKGPSAGEKIKKKLHVNKPASEQVEGQRRKSSTSSGTSDEDSSRAVAPATQTETFTSSKAGQLNVAPVAAEPGFGEFNTRLNAQAPTPGQGQVHELTREENNLPKPGYSAEKLEKPSITLDKPTESSYSTTSATSEPAKSSDFLADETKSPSFVETGTTREFKEVDPTKLERQIPSYIPSETLAEPNPIELEHIKNREILSDQPIAETPAGVAFFVPLDSGAVLPSLEPSTVSDDAAESEESVLQRIRNAVIGPTDPYAPTISERADDVLQRVKTIISKPFVAAPAGSVDRPIDRPVDRSFETLPAQETILQRVQNMFNARFSAPPADTTIVEHPDYETYRTEPAESFLARVRHTLSDTFSSIQTTVAANMPTKEGVQNALNTSKDMAASALSTSRDAAVSAMHTGQNVAASIQSTVAANMPSKEAVQGALNSSKDMAASALNTSRDMAASALQTGRDAAVSTYSTIKERLPESHPAAEESIATDREATDEAPQSETFMQKVKNFVEPYLHLGGQSAEGESAGVEPETVKEWPLQADTGIPTQDRSEELVAAPALSAPESGIDRSHVILPSQVHQLEASSGVDRTHVILPSQVQDLEARAAESRAALDAENRGAIDSENWTSKGAENPEYLDAESRAAMNAQSQQF